MPRPRRNPDIRIDAYASRVTRHQTLREAGGWIGTVELSPAAHEALRALQGDRSISATIEAALVAAAREIQAQKKTPA
jgi:hypothetical protein